MFSTIIFLCLAIGFFGGFYSVDKDLIKEATKQEIEKRLVDGQVINPIPDEVYVLRDVQVIEIGNDFILVNHPDNQDPLMRLFPYETVKILIGANTMIRHRIIKDQAQYQQEMQIFLSAVDKENLQEPVPYIIKASKIEDLQLGYHIDYAQTQENIKGKGVFLAEEIIFSYPNETE